MNERRNNLPTQLTPFLGRAEEGVAVRRRLCHAQVRLLTLTGPGGIGKTRLALQVAAQLLDHFADGVWFADLSPLRDPALVAATIAAALGVKEVRGRPVVESLKAYLREKQILLVLDNFEQVLPAALLVDDLLHAAPGLQILVTSRVMLRVYSEHDFLVPSLDVPDLMHPAGLDRLLHCDAVRLFVDRAQAVKQDFRVSDENVRAVAEICHHLDGLPLAIELAASRIRVLPPQAMLARLSSRLKLLTGGARTLPARQQTLRDTLAWSYDLLDPAEQMLFRWLAVFSGGWTLEAAEAVCNAADGLPFDILDGLQSLIDKSLLREAAGIAGEPRYGMLETIREYALDRLQANGEMAALQWRHAAYYLAFAETAAPEVLGPQQVAWLDRLEVDHNNLRAALAWSRAEREQWEEGVRLAIALGDFWGRRGYMSEGRRWLEGALAQMEGRAAEPRACALRAEALYGAATLAMLQYDTTTPPPLLEESLALFRALGNTWGVASALRNLGCTAAILEGDHGRGIALLEESLALFHTLGDRWGMAWTLSFLGWAFHAQGNYTRAARLLEESLAHFREAGDLHGIGTALGNLGTLTAKQGDFTQAAVCLRESLGLHRAMGSKVGIGIALEAVAGLEALQAHEPEAMARAARLCAAAEALHASLGSEAFAGVRGDRERMVATLRTCLDEEAFAVTWAEGRAMTPEQAIAYALEDAPHSEQAIARHPPLPQTAPAAESRQYPAGLTDREVEILRLVTQGLTYAQIAERLIISSHTVNAHLRTIYGKLGVNSRSSATRFAVEHRLV